MVRSLVLVCCLALAVSACNLSGGITPGDETTSSTVAVTTTTQPVTTTVTLPPAETSERGVVTEVTDGDTFTASIGGQSVEVRLLGINAPELDECFGGDALSVLTRAIGGSEVVLERGEEDLDQFGRALRYAYVETAEGTQLVNRDLVAEGFAVAMQSGHPRQDEFKAIEGDAYSSGRGMWATFACGEPEGGFPDRPQIRFHDGQSNPPGADDENIDEEWIEILNLGYGRVNLSGWVVRDESSVNRFTIPNGTVLGVGDTLRIVTGCVTSGGNVLGWCADTPVWNNDGDTALLLDDLGNVVHRWVIAPVSDG